MISNAWLRNFALVVLGAVLFLGGVLVGQNKFGTPNTLVHTVVIKWKDGVSEADKQKALDGVKEMAAKIPGMRNVWIKARSIQPREFTHGFVMEFDGPDAEKVYADHPAHKEWEKHYLSIREESRHSDFVN